MTSAHDQEEKSAGSDDQRAILERFCELSSLGTDAVLMLTNIYKEMPITHPASICEVKGHHLALYTSELQLAAICQCKEVFIRSPHFELPVLGRLDSIDVRRGVVLLSDFSYGTLRQEDRKTVRVRFKKPLNVMMHSGSDRIPGIIHDISLGGCCLNTLICKGLRESDQIELELKLLDQGSGELCCTRIPSEVIQIRGEISPFKCILCFRHTQQSEQFLSVFINQRQLEILKELREAL